MTDNREIALVTGATRGIGKSIALALGRQGAVVVGTATSDAGAQAIAAFLEDAGIVGNGLVLDVGDPRQIADCLAEMAGEFGYPSILVNNAGITRDNLLLRMKEDDWEAVIHTNLSSIFHLAKACLRPMMKARHGRIISIASVVGVAGNAGQCNYAAAKAGILGFTKSLAREVAPRGITVNAVAPGFIDTDMTAQLDAATRESLLNQVPLGRLGRPEEVAAVVAFLASPAAAYVTGETIHVNGGMYMN